MRIYFSPLLFKTYHPRYVLSFLLALFFLSDNEAQFIISVNRGGGSGFSVSSFITSGNITLELPQPRPLYSFAVNDRVYNSSQAEVRETDSSFVQIYENQLLAEITFEEPLSEWRAGLRFTNNGSDTVSISNIVPFGAENTSALITGFGPWDLARAYLFRPGYEKVRVILPDNAWELGYSSFETAQQPLCALARRGQATGGQKKRYETLLPPGTSVSYTIYAQPYTGDWQEGLRVMFRDKYLYDLTKFDNSLFERADLQWIKRSYIIILQMAWDRNFFDRSTGRFTYADELRSWNEKFGFVDVFGIWPTWPRLGLDQRNQWDMYRALPGGTSQLRNFARMSRQYNTRFFISYNPWDNSTRLENHYSGMARLISETEADGVVLDTRGSSSYELQAAADSVRKGVVMFSEGMAIVKDMPGIIAGRVHNAIYYSPELNLNKLIKPDFSIFRVCDVGEDYNHREIAIAFFNGYGTELNMFRPGRRDGIFNDDLNFLSATTFILRQNNDAFLDKNWTPLISTLKDKVYVNRWVSGEKTIYTILNMRQEGSWGPLFPADTTGRFHYVSLWNHESLMPETVSGKPYIRSSAPGWDPSFSGTRREASLDCIARFPVIIKSRLRNDSLFINGSRNGIYKLWKVNPSASARSFNLKVNRDTVFRLSDLLSHHEGKLVIQYLENEQLGDEVILNAEGGKPWLVSRIERTSRGTSMPADMILIPGSSIKISYSTREDFIPYPAVNTPLTFKVDSFLIDTYPVTNEQFYNFLLASGYVPSDTSNFLKHWDKGIFRPGQEKYPVVYVSREDMLAYAKWAGKRLPAESEWQLAAQGTDGRKWPWGNEFYGTKCNNGFDRPTPVDAFPKGGSPFGVMDLVGNIWQATNDLYFNGTNYFFVIRGGSYYKPESSWWYIQGGPQELDRTQIMLMMSQGFDRSATLGFRCAKDIDPAFFRPKERKQR